MSALFFFFFIEAYIADLQCVIFCCRAKRFNISVLDNTSEFVPLICHLRPIWKVLLQQEPLGPHNLSSFSVHVNGGRSLSFHSFFFWKFLI